MRGSSPPRSQVARKLISPFPSPHPYTPHSKIPTPWGFLDPNIHLQRRHLEPGSQDPAQWQLFPGSENCTLAVKICPWKRTLFPRREKCLLEENPVFPERENSPPKRTLLAGRESCSLEENSVPWKRILFPERDSVPRREYCSLEENSVPNGVPWKRKVFPWREQCSVEEIIVPWKRTIFPGRGQRFLEKISVP